MNRGRGRKLSTFILVVVPQEVALKNTDVF